MKEDADLTTVLCYRLHFGAQRTAGFPSQSVLSPCPAGVLPRDPGRNDSSSRRITLRNQAPQRSFFPRTMSDCCESRPSKIQRVGEGEAEKVAETHVGVENKVATRGENEALKGTQPFAASRYSDFLSNVSNFKIIESTLRGVYFS